MTTFTPEQAKDFKCPVARTFIRGPVSASDSGCMGDTCAAWRWQPIPASILAPHITRRLKDTGGGLNSHKEAVAWVMANREALGIPLKPPFGYCGLGGPVEA